MRCQLAEARVSWGKGEADVALRTARAVATRLRVNGGGVAERRGGGRVELGGSGEREKQCLLSEVRSSWVGVQLGRWNVNAVFSRF